MARKELRQLVDLGNLHAKRELLTAIGRLDGLYEVSIAPRRNTRTNQQNRYYWACVVKSFTDFMTDQGQPIPALEAHGFLKRKFLPLELVNPQTGEVLDTIADSSHDKDIAAFAAYIDQCTEWLASTFGIVVPTPDQYAPQRTEADIAKEQEDPCPF